MARAGIEFQQCATSIFRISHSHNKIQLCHPEDVALSCRGRDSAHGADVGDAETTAARVSDEKLDENVPRRVREQLEWQRPIPCVPREPLIKSLSRESHRCFY